MDGEHEVITREGRAVTDSIPEVEREMQRVEGSAHQLPDIITMLYDRLSSVVRSEDSRISLAERAHAPSSTEMAKRLSGTGDLLDCQIARLLELVERIEL